MRVILFLLTALLLVAGPVRAQPQVHQINVYHLDNQNGTVFIFAENNRFVPVTIDFSAWLVQLKCADALPAKFVVFPSK